MSPHTLTGKALLENGDLLDIIIGTQLGHGLGYDDWKKELESRGGFTWTESLKNIVIKKEFSFFREEILRLQSEPNATRGLKSKTNSLESILKRLQGFEWVKGVPNEMEQRKRDGMLLGKDAKARCLQYHVSRWKAEAASASNQSPTSVISGEYLKAMPKRKDTNVVSPDLTCTAMPVAATTSTTEHPTTAHSPNNGMFANGDSFTSQKLLHISNSDILSIFGQMARLPDFDPTLSGDHEIPWVPHTYSQEVGTHGVDITCDDFFDFVEQDPNFPIEPPSNELSFELPRRHGINDSYETYVSQASQDPTMQKSIIEGILDHYGSQPSKDIWLTSLTPEDAHSSVHPQLEQQQTYSEIIPFSQQSFEIPPQDLMHNDWRSEADNDQFSHNIDTEALALGNTSSSENSQQEDQEASMCLSRDQNEPVTLAPAMAKNSSEASEPFHGSERPSGRALAPENGSFYHIGAELRKKRNELAAAENTAFKLLTEIKMLEEAFAKRGSQHFEAISFENIHMQKTSNKRGNDKILHGAKKLKERAAATNFDSVISKSPSAKGEETICLTGGHLSTTKDNLPRTISTAGGRACPSFNQNNKSTASKNAGGSAISTSKAPVEAVHHPGEFSSRTFSDPYPPVALQAEKNSAVQSSSMQTPWSEPLKDSTNGFSRDSGYDSLDMGLFNCRASSIDDLEGSIAWVT